MKNKISKNVKLNRFSRKMCAVFSASGTCPSINQLHKGHICSAKPHVSVDPLQPIQIRIFPGLLLTNMYYFLKNNAFAFWKNSLQKLVNRLNNRKYSVNQ